MLATLSSNSAPLLAKEISWVHGDSLLLEAKACSRMVIISLSCSDVWPMTRRLVTILHSICTLQD